MDYFFSISADSWLTVQIFVYYNDHRGCYAIWPVHLFIASTIT